jgi:hypothetical protein
MKLGLAVPLVWLHHLLCAIGMGCMPCQCHMSRQAAGVGSQAGPSAQGTPTVWCASLICTKCQRCCCSLFFLLPLQHQANPMVQRLHCRAGACRSDDWKTLAWLSSNSPRHPHLQVLSGLGAHLTGNVQRQQRVHRQQSSSRSNDLESDCPSLERGMI